MKTPSTLLLLGVLSVSVPVQASDIDINFVYDAPSSTTLKDLSRGPLSVSSFTDGRGVDDPNLIADSFRSSKPLAEVVRDALVQGFENSGAVLVDTGENISLEGNIVSSSIEQLEANGVAMIRLTIRSEVKLQGSGRTLWQTVLFGRGEAPVADGITPAVHQALERMIRGLLQDDYFLIEIK